MMFVKLSRDEFTHSEIHLSAFLGHITTMTTTTIGMALSVYLFI